MVKPSLSFTDFFPDVAFHKDFEKQLRKIKDNQDKLEIKKLIKKVICEPVRQKHMQYTRKGLQEEYNGSSRLYFKYSKKEKTLYFVELSHKDEQ